MCVIIKCIRRKYIKIIKPICWELYICSIFFYIIFFQSLSFNLSATLIKVPGDFPTIQLGIDNSINGDTVLVANGTYSECINFKQKKIIVMSDEGCDSTLISGTGENYAVEFNFGEDKNSRLIGFGITNLLTKGGILCSKKSSPTLSGSKVFNTKSNGIKIYDDSSPIIENCEISNNDSTGIFIKKGIPKIKNTIINSNKRSGIILSNTDVEVVQCVINENDGYGIYASQAKGTMQNNLILNSSMDGVYSLQSTINIYNNTVLNNKASGIYGQYTQSPVINNIITGSGKYGIFFSVNTTSILQYNDAYSNSEANFSGSGLPPFAGQMVLYNRNGDPSDPYFNISLDPKFKDPFNGDYSLTEFSPCVDAGDPAFQVPPGGGDFIDMGYKEYVQLGVDEKSSSTPLNSPLKIELRNYPNPFNPLTTIEINIKQKMYLTLQIYDINGSNVRNLLNGEFDSGLTKVIWDGKNNKNEPCISGIYFYKLMLDGNSITKKMMILK